MKRILIAVFFLTSSASLYAQNPFPSTQETPELTAESYSLHQCALLQTGDTPRLYLTSSTDELEAFDPRDGKKLWGTSKAVIPLLARGSRLLAYLPPPKGKWEWSLGVLDARSGKILERLQPQESFKAAVGQGLSGSFGLQGRTWNGRDYLISTTKWWPVPGGAYRPN